MINPRIFYDAATIANASVNANVVESLPDFSDITRPYPDNNGEFDDE